MLHVGLDLVAADRECHALPINHLQDRPNRGIELPQHKSLT